jgi:hypothetical protein
MSNTELSKYLSAAQRKAAIQTGRNDLINSIKTGDDAHNCKNYMVEATDHRWVKEKLDDLKIFCKDRDSIEAHVKNCGIIHNGHYINTAYENDLGLDFDDMLYLHPYGYYGKPGYLPKPDFANQIDQIDNQVHQTPSYKNYNSSYAHTNLPTANNLMESHQVTNDMSLNDMLSLLQ